MVERRPPRRAGNRQISTKPLARALAVGLWLCAAPPPQASAAPAPTGLLAGHVHLATPEGRVVDNMELSGRPYALFFGFTHCPNVCPTVLQDLGAAMQRLPASMLAGIDVFFVSIDPERDTPAALAAYMRDFDPRIVALTGSRADVDEAVASFGAVATRMAEPGGAYTFNHTASIFLVDGNGLVVDMAGADLDAAALSAKLAGLATPPARGRP